MFTIEYYPETKRHYPKVADHFIRKDYNTGIVEVRDRIHMMYAHYGATHAEAVALIDLYKEQQLKENVIITEVQA